jgi:hypothetical protein
LATDGRTEYDFWNRYVTGAPEDLISRFLDEGTDARSLIVRVLVTARGAAREGMTADDIVGFLEGSFGAFQASQRHERWEWSRHELVSALTDLIRHGLIEDLGGGRFQLTDLGRLAGESTTEVASIIKLVDGIRSIRSEEISDPALITAAQMTVEVDQVLFPINKKSTQKEPQTWSGELRRQGVPQQLLALLARSAVDTHQATMRAKKAVACLLFVSGRALNEIEATLTQFGGGFDGAAGPIRAAAARTCDLLPTAARVAEILNPDLDLAERVARLAVRLTLGVPAAAVELAQLAGADLLRGDYRRLVNARLCDPDAIDGADDRSLLNCVDGDVRKLEIVRRASGEVRQRREWAAAVSVPILEPYVA